MESFIPHSCVACNAATLKLPEEEIQLLLTSLPRWNLTSKENITMLSRRYLFEDFLSALHFVNKVGALAQECDHHPTLVLEWGRVEVSWWTHSVEGLHINDFILAAKMNEQFEE